MDDFFEYLSNIFYDFDFKKLIFPTIMVLLYAAGFVYLLTIINKKNTNVEIKTNNISKEIEEVKVQDIYVDVKGSVKTPGVYKLKSDARVSDAVEAAGGILKDANTRFINLSKQLKDGDVVVVYSNSEIEKAKEDNIVYIETPCICEEVKNDACYKEEESNGKININTASLEELKTITGIGDAKASAIIEYRTQNGRFNTIEDIKKVSGISETLFDKIKDFITV